MPIIIKDYTWEQSESSIYVTIPLKGVTIRKVDLFSTPSYFKIHFAPYLCEVFLFDSVDVSFSKAQITDSTIVLNLEKSQPSQWPHLENQQAEDKNTKKELREFAINWKHDNEKKREEEKNTLKQKLSRYGVKEQMNFEDKNRAKIEEVKKYERDAANESIELWKIHQNQLEKQMKIDRNNQETQGELKFLKPKRGVEEIFENQESGIEEIADVECKGDNDMSREREQHPIRKKSVINVTHTKRVFPTPTRQSQQHLEDEWLAKQADMKRIMDVEDANLTEEEKNPVWLCSKGDKFFKNRDYKSAINAYSHAVRMNYRLPCIFSNRAACHLMLGNYMRCIEDASKALEYLKPAVDSNAASRTKAHIRRGTALVHLEMYIEGLKDYEIASSLDKDNVSILQDCDNIRDKIQGSQV